jgi:hypothetical protein
MWTFATVTTKWRNTMQPDIIQRACAICQSPAVTTLTWDKVPLCEIHWQERELMHLGSDELFHHRRAVESFERAVQKESSPAPTATGPLCA